MQVGEIEIKRSAGHVVMQFHDGTDARAWVIPVDAARQLGEALEGDKVRWLLRARADPRLPS